MKIPAIMSARPKYCVHEFIRSPNMKNAAAVSRTADMPSHMPFTYVTLPTRRLLMR